MHFQKLADIINSEIKSLLIFDLTNITILLFNETRFRIMSTVFVTGASGMIGMYLTSSLLQKGHKVIATDSKSNSFVGKENYSFVQCEISDKNAITDIINSNKIDTVVHLALTVDNDISSFITDQEEKAAKLSDKFLYKAVADRDIKNFILISTTTVYPVMKTREPIRETADTKPFSDYAKYKLEAEEHLMKEFKKSDCVPVIARVAPIYTAEYTQNLRDRVYDTKDDVAFVYGDGSYGFSFCCLFNLVDFINGIIAGPSGRYDGIYNVCDTRPTTAKEILDFEREHHRIGAVIQRTPGALSNIAIAGKKAKSDYRYVDYATLLHNWSYDNTKAQRIATFRWKLANTK